MPAVLIMADDEYDDEYDDISDGEKLAIVKYFVTHTPPGHTKTIIEGELVVMSLCLLHAWSHTEMHCCGIFVFILFH